LSSRGLGRAPYFFDSFFCFLPSFQWPLRGRVQAFFFLRDVLSPCLRRLSPLFFTTPAFWLHKFRVFLFTPAGHLAFLQCLSLSSLAVCFIFPRSSPPYFTTEESEVEASFPPPKCRDDPHLVVLPSLLFLFHTPFFPLLFELQVLRIFFFPTLTAFRGPSPGSSPDGGWLFPPSPHSPCVLLCPFFCRGLLF